MVTIHYIGRTFNNLFQYSFCRLLAKVNELELATKWNHQDVVQITEPSGGTKGLIPIWLRDCFQNERDINWLKPRDFFKDKHILVKGYFQYHDFYEENKGEILSWMVLPPITGEYKDCAVIHCRLDDYDTVTAKPVIDPSWYYSILRHREEWQFRELHLVMSRPTKEWENEYLQKIKILMPMVKINYCENAVDDWNFIRQFGVILCSNSSFCWWASFTSEARKIYVFDRWLPGSVMVDLADTVGWQKVSGKYFWE